MGRINMHGESLFLSCCVLLSLFQQQKCFSVSGFEVFFFWEGKGSVKSDNVVSEWMKDGCSVARPSPTTAPGCSRVCLAWQPKKLLASCLSWFIKHSMDSHARRQMSSADETCSPPEQDDEICLLDCSKKCLHTQQARIGLFWVRNHMKVLNLLHLCLLAALLLRFMLSRQRELNFVQLWSSIALRFSQEMEN